MADLSSEPKTLRDAFAATLDWWREAGVEEFVEDAPGGWLRSANTDVPGGDAVAQSAATPPVEATPEPVRRGALSRFLEAEGDGQHPGDPAQWPTDLDKFVRWWMESDAVDAPGAYPRIAPRGPAEARAILILPQPQEQDGDALLGGPAGTLADSMLRAFGFAAEEIRYASVLPRHTLRPDWDAVAAAGYGRLLLHHIALARPERIVACGERVWSLLAHGAAQEPQALTTITTDSARIPVFAIPDMQALLRNPASRAQTWNRWLDWNDSPR
ncbi:MAG: hypothetical protein GW855_02845 [Erythrobacter sp.]|nr:hypothetical protein [Erythrobacter sp.]NCQ63981.1 hypothetical protein [Alphaproteobacteria bacterium]